MDEASHRLVFNVVKEDELLAEKILSAYFQTYSWNSLTYNQDIEKIEQRRKTNREYGAVYFLTPDEHIVDCHPKERYGLSLIEPWNRR